jgi:IS5 family transposase
MKAHIGVDKTNGLVHSLLCTSAEVYDSQPIDKLLHGKEKELYGDSAYASKAKMGQTVCSGKFWLNSRLNSKR